MKHPHPALADAAPTSAWLDSALRPAPRPALAADTTADLVIVGGGYSGLWTAVLAKERDPGREVVLLEAQRIGWAASGRNGGFCSASLTHGKDNGEQRFPDEIDTLERLGRQNLTELESAVGRYGIDCDFELTGSLSVATEPHQVTWLREAADAGEGEYLDRDAIRAEVASPTYLAGLWTRDDNALVDPARLAWGLADAAERLGVRIHEDTHVSELDKDGSGLAVRTASGHTVRAGRVALGTNAFPSLVRRVRWHTVPGLRLRADDRAAVGRAAGLDRLAPPAGHRRLRQPVPLLPAHRRTTGSCGAATTRSTTSAGGSPATSTTGRRLSTCWRASSSRRSPSWRGCASATSGAAPSTPAPGSSPSTARRTPAGRRTRSATPAWASAPPGSAPT